MTLSRLIRGLVDLTLGATLLLMGLFVGLIKIAGQAARGGRR